MARIVLVFLAALAITTAMVPRSKRATEEEAVTPPPPSPSTTAVHVCTSTTPCGWTVYTPFTKTIEYFMKNNYCECGENLSCSYYDDDISIGAFVHRCQIPVSSTTAPSYADASASASASSAL